jgi:hypothetical protein
MKSCKRGSPGRSGRRYHPVPDVCLVARVTGFGDSRHLWQRDNPRSRRDGEHAQRARVELLGHLLAELGKIQPIDKNIDRPDRIVLTHIIVQKCGEQHALPAIYPLNKSASSDPPKFTWESYRANHIRRSLFTQAGPEAAVH